MRMYINALCVYVPHNWMDVGMWCCSNFAFVRLPESATFNINQSPVFSNRMLYVHKQHYDFCLGSGFLGELDEDLTLKPLQ